MNEHVNQWAMALRELRQQRGLTQRAAAQQLGLALRTWINWEAGHRTPGTPAQRLLALTWPDFPFPEKERIPAPCT